MEVKDAVRLAKSYVADLFADEKIRDIGLEEADFDETSDRWMITVGFRRPFERNVQRQDNSFMTMFKIHAFENRWYKCVTVDSKSGKVVSMHDRLLRDAA